MQLGTVTLLASKLPPLPDDEVALVAAVVDKATSRLRIVATEATDLMFWRINAAQLEGRILKSARACAVYGFSVMPRDYEAAEIRTNEGDTAPGLISDLVRDGLYERLYRLFTGNRSL